VRVHSECLTGEALHSLRCDCGAQLEEALRRAAEEGGAVVYLRQEGRGIGLFEKIRAYTLQDQGMDTVEANLALGHDADLRRFGAAAAVLRRAGYDRVRLLTNNPEKIAALRIGGVTVTERIPLHVGFSHHNQGYMATKIARMGHLEEEREEEG
jgi:GTP cyclohydrolase II